MVGNRCNVSAESLFATTSHSSVACQAAANQKQSVLSTKTFLEEDHVFGMTFPCAALYVKASKGHSNRPVCECSLPAQRQDLPWAAC
eukprot:1148212-Pelagomonas_calceolata.AAC.3